MKSARGRRGRRRIAVIHNTDFATRSTPADGKSSSLEADAEVAVTAGEIADILHDGGWRACVVSVQDTIADLPEFFRASRIDAVFNLVESLGNDCAREGELPAMLEQIGIPYTGNPPLALRLALAKDFAKRMLAAHSLPVPHGMTVFQHADLTAKAIAKLSFPLFVKPARSDASIGIDQGSIVADADALRRRVTWLLDSGLGPALVEEYLPGREINVAIFPDPFTGAIVPTEIDFSSYTPDLAPIVTYNCKWLPSTPEYNAFSKPCADKLPPALLNEVRRLARAAFLAVGGASYGRVDMRLGRDGRPRIIDVNPNNDLDRDAGLAIAARSVGLEYPALIVQIAEGACLKEHHVSSTVAAAGPRLAGRAD
jgi:D-alanine-D-alanine ligase